MLALVGFDRNFLPGLFVGDSKLPQKVHYWVPQDSVLGPALFSTLKVLYILTLKILHEGFIYIFKNHAAIMTLIMTLQQRTHSVLC